MYFHLIYTGKCGMLITGMTAIHDMTGGCGMKKAVVIWSSANKDGLTASAKDQFIKGLTGAAEVEEIWLDGLRPEHCRACGNGWGSCNKTGTCVIRDSFEQIYKSLAEADGIVWISAVYWSDMTEQFKAFFDRLRRCDAMYNHFLADKRCVLIACAGGTGRGSIECLTQFERGLGHMGMRVYDRISVVRYNKGYILPALPAAGRAYADALEKGFDMYY